MAVITVTKENFTKEVMEASSPVLLDFWASWCGPCKMIAPVIAEIGDERAGSLVVGKVNVDEQPELEEKFSVMSIPTLLVFEQGKVKNSAVGAMAKSNILALVDA